MKPKNTSITKLIKKLDAVFSFYIRLRAADSNGFCRCYTCGSVRQWTGMDCCHFVKRQHKGTRFNEINCQAGCKICNWLKQGNDIEFRKHLVRDYGEAQVLLLESAVHKSVKWSNFELQYMIKDYTERVKQLREEKGL